MKTPVPLTRSLIIGIVLTFGGFMLSAGRYTSAVRSLRPLRRPIDPRRDRARSYGEDVPEPFVPADFEVPSAFDGPGFHLEPLGPVHNERDYRAWMSSIEHIKATPGMDWGTWPSPMTLEENLADLEMHAKEFADRESFTYSILDGDMVIGCVYIYPAKDDYDAVVRSWVTESRSELDPVVWEALSGWLTAEWPFDEFFYASRT